MEVNFKIKNLIEVIYNGNAIDLHNCYYFLFNEFIIDEKNIIIPFYRYKDIQVTPYSPFDKLIFKAFNYSFFENNVNELEELDKAEGISEITFFPSDDRDNLSSLIDQEDPKPTDDLKIVFLSGRVIILATEKVLLTTENY
ncbi:hypothetical protein M3B46_03165 [Sphingobacterium daejeonense]|uniref:hypothetical protein n=1 Tax=Sphingobacterium daejeonense TaxID=371142 RepID=UPI0021A3AEE9|nr:hypothetical protein [Sphingobacterium daejeonense]MCT1529978.1 hypothetical protein [Sphingobacterium daejeonense]